MAEPIDWGLARSTGIRTAGGVRGARGPRSGPDVSPADAAEAVAALRQAAVDVQGPVADITGLYAPPEAPAHVVDRAEWVRSNVSSLATLVAPMAGRVGSSPMQAVTAKVGAVQVGLALGWLSSKVLGQYEVLPGEGDAPRLLLVAPNIVTAGTEMDVDLGEFGRWVCMHEETHRVQFGAVPWLPDFFRTNVTALVDDLDVGPGEVMSRIASGMRGGAPGGVAAWVQSPAGRERLERLLGLMTLVEGHADWVMDQSGDVIPSAPQLRAEFEARRRAGGVLDNMIRKVLGMDAKLAQYRDGAAFVRHVTGAVGRDEFNLVWTSPETLPTLAEIHQPDSWIDRVVRG